MAGIKCIGILTSGGDAPGMNAAIRAVTRSAIFNGFTVKGIMRGYKGLVFNEIVEFKSQSVSNIIQLGGTILKTARSQEFTTPEGRKAAYDTFRPRHKMATLEEEYQQSLDYYGEIARLFPELGATPQDVETAALEKVYQARHTYQMFEDSIPTL